MNNIDRQYKELSYHILNFGVDKADRTGTGTKSIFGWQIRHNMKDGFPLLTTKKMAWKSIVTELLWFLRGDTNIKFLVDNGCHIWDGDAYKRYYTYFDKLSEGIPHTKEEFIDKIKTDEDFEDTWGDLGPIYGKQWRNWKYVFDWKGVAAGMSITYDIEGDSDYIENEKYGIDQIANLISELKTNPDSRRLMVSAWNVGELDQMVLPPCHYGFQVYTRELTLQERMIISIGDTAYSIPEENIDTEWLDRQNIPTRAISLMWNQRSVDTFLGLPFNIASYGLLLEIIAKEVNMVPEDLIGNLGDVHLYNNHIEQAKEQLSRTPYELPKLNINTEWWDKPFIELVMSDSFCKCLLEEDIQLYDYKSHPAIKAPLSN
jgi:thymidylate synthase